MQTKDNKELGWGVSCKPRTATGSDVNGECSNLCDLDEPTRALNETVQFYFHQKIHIKLHVT